MHVSACARAVMDSAALPFPQRHLSRADPLPPPGPGVNEVHAADKARGVDMQGYAMPQPWGMRELAIRDCNGCALRFGTPG